MKVSELTGAKLDHWVARAEGMDFVLRGQQPALVFDFDPERHANEHDLKAFKQYVWFQPSANWTQGGPIIAREKIDLLFVEDKGRWDDEPDHWNASGRADDWGQNGPDPLVAAMRWYVASKFGDEVPDEEAA